MCIFGSLKTASDFTNLLHSLNIIISQKDGNEVAFITEFIENMNSIYLDSISRSFFVSNMLKQTYKGACYVTQL